MLFSIYCGNHQGVVTWRQIVEQHARWLDLSPVVETRQVADGSSLVLSWLTRDPAQFGASVQETPEYLIANSTGSINCDRVRKTGIDDCRRLSEELKTNIIQSEISLETGEIKIVVPPTTPEQFFYAIDKRGVVLGNDMRLLMRWAGMELDERAVYALFQYRAIPPPLTMSKTVRRIPNGHLFKLPPESKAPSIEVFYRPEREVSEVKTASAAEELIEATLDDILTQVPSLPVLYFSGGVDSGLLAARLAELGRRDVLLVNYSFSPADPEGQLALKMASHLGLACEQVMFDPEDLHHVLARLGEDYSFPFGDLSQIPTNLLVHASLRSLGHSFTVIEGTGGDGGFGISGIHRRWETIYRIPSPIRRAVAEGYKWLKLWRYDSVTEGRGRKIRRSVQMPLHQAAMIANTPLNGIAYEIPRQIEGYLEEAVRKNVEVLGSKLGPDEQMILLDMIHVCAGRFAAKSSEPLSIHGVQPVYPFLEPSILGLSHSIPGNLKNEGGEHKAILKRMLARSVPSEMVYRRKSTFTPPTRQMFAGRPMQEFLGDVVMSRQNPIIDFIDEDIVTQMIARSQKGLPLSISTHNFLWILMVTSGWLDQLEL